MRAEAFDDKKLATLEVTVAARTRYFTSAQARDLLKTFDFDQARIKAAVLLYPRLIDPENFFVALEAFTFDNSRKEVREKLKLTK